ncbi:MAG: Rpn family recombination-promoting nuclease/putative transposase [Actinomycetia bacterium]|nr:Rpn family recombination-promoting nuclease/putative transposase [Actinomycetes bacterium]
MTDERERREIAQAHDRLHRHVFGRPEHLAGQRSLLPAEVVERIDLASLTRVEATFVDPALRLRQSDVLMRARFDGRDGYVYVLEEHQSTEDALMAFRMLAYMVRIWEHHLGEHPYATSLPLILPIVLYHGRKPWSKPVEVSELVDVDPGLADMLGGLMPRCRFVLDDLRQADDGALRARPLTPAGRVVLTLIRDSHDGRLVGRALWSVITDLHDMIDTTLDGIEVWNAVVTYILGTNASPPHDLHDIAHELGAKTEETYMTAARMLRAEGLAEGLTDLLTQKFGELPAPARARIDDADLDQLKVWTHRVLSAGSLDEVLR